MGTTTYQRNYMRKIRQDKYAFTNWKYNITKVNNEFKDKSILPKHIYMFRPVLKDMLKHHFKKKILKKYERIELITQSYFFHK
jgi:hypothetical protein